MLHLQHNNRPSTCFKYHHRYEPVCVLGGELNILFIYVFNCHSKLNGTLHLWSYNTYVEELKETHLTFLMYSIHTYTEVQSHTHGKHRLFMKWNTITVA